MTLQTIVLFILFIYLVTALTHIFFDDLKMRALLLKKRFQGKTHTPWINENKVNQKWAEIEPLILEKYKSRQ